MITNVTKVALPKLMTNHLSCDENFNSEVLQKFPTVPNQEEFNRRFFLFTHGVLEGLNWSNVFCAGGSVLGNQFGHVTLNNKLQLLYLNPKFSALQTRRFSIIISTVLGSQVTLIFSSTV